MSNKTLEILEEIKSSIPEENLVDISFESLGYIITKAIKYLEVGPDNYRGRDAFDMPDISWTQSDLSEIEQGCNQILEGKGLTQSKPITDISIKGMYNLLSLFHFEFKSKRSNYTSKGIIDGMTFKHVLDSKEIQLFFSIHRADSK